MATPNYTVDYEDERFDKVDDAMADQNQMIDQSYGEMIGQVDQHYQNLQNQIGSWADQQQQIQQQQTDFTIEQINQQKAQAEKDYKKEQSGAYVDWRKQSNEYGVEAEKMAASGLADTGYSESSQVSMYNTYQNRVATARESYNQAVLNYNNAIKDAQLQNNAALAEIAANALQKQLELSIEGFQYKNQLIDTYTTKKIALDDTKWNRYQDVLNQINTENAMKEEVRQFESSQAFTKQQNELDRQHQLRVNEINNQFEEAQNALDRQHDFKLLEAKTQAEKEAAKLEHERAMEKLAQQQAYAIAQIDAEYEQKRKTAKYEADLAKANTYSYSSSNSGSKSGSSSYTGGKTATTTNSKGQTYSLYDSNVKAAISPSVPINKNSLLGLGLGPVSNEYVYKLVEQDKVSVTKKNGEYYLSWKNK